MHPNAIVAGTADVAVAGVALGAFAGYLPDVAAGMTVIYMTARFVHWCWTLWRG